MNPRLLDYLADPNDGGALQLHTFEGAPDQTREGVLVNAQTGRWYPVRDGIPTLFSDALRSAGTAMGGVAQSDAEFVARFGAPMREAGCRLEKAAASSGAAASNGDLSSAPMHNTPPDDDFARMESERRARDEQAEDYDRMWALKIYERIETPVYRRALQPYLADGANAANASGANANGTNSNGVGADVMKPSVANPPPLLEAGCGTGRFTALFSELAPEVVAVDLSRDSIERNRVRHAGKTASSVHYVHADLTHLPLRDAAFGAVAHCGVYEHIPSRAMRRQFLSHARRALHPGGVLLLSAYRYGGLTRLFGKEGEHAGGIPFTRFTEAELRAELESYFQIERFRPSLGVYMSMLLARPLR